MAEEASTTESEETSQEETKDEELDVERAKAKIAKTNSEAASLRKRLKEAEAKAARLDELEESKKSEQEKLVERIAAADRLAVDLEAKILRYEVAAAKELPTELVEFLTGETEEELEAQADKLLAYANQFEEDEDDDAPPSRQPKENLRPGRKGKEPSVNDDPLLASLKAKIGA